MEEKEKNKYYGHVHSLMGNFFLVVSILFVVPLLYSNSPVDDVSAGYIQAVLVLAPIWISISIHLSTHATNIEDTFVYSLVPYLYPVSLGLLSVVGGGYILMFFIIMSLFGLPFLSKTLKSKG